MTRNDLISGMVVEQRNGDRKLVVGNMLIGEDDWSMLDDYRDNFDMIGLYREFDITKVYNPDKGLGGLRLPKNNFSNLSEEFLVWSRVNEESKAKGKHILEMLLSYIDSLSEEELGEVVELGEKIVVK